MAGQKDEEDWEAVCIRCGRCCVHKFEDEDGRIEWTNVVCKHLNLQTHLCAVYDSRLEVCPDCEKVTPEYVKSRGWIPDGCAYAAAARGEDPGRAPPPTLESLGFVSENDIDGPLEDHIVESG